MCDAISPKPHIHIECYFLFILSRVVRCAVCGARFNYGGGTPPKKKK